MRVFYIDEDENTNNESMPTYYVKLENVSVPDELKGYKAFNASSTSELIDQISTHYNIKTASIELWSGQVRQGQRLDTMPTIPKEYEFIWVRAKEKQTGQLLPENATTYPTQ